MDDFEVLVARLRRGPTSFVECVPELSGSSPRKIAHNTIEERVLGRRMARKMNSRAAAPPARWYVRPQTVGGNNSVEPSEYALEPLRQDDQVTLYRGCSASAQPTRVLMLGPACANPEPDTLRRIDHEY